MTTEEREAHPASAAVELWRKEKRDRERKHYHYYKDVSGLQTVDVYRVLELFSVVNPCLQHAVKKLLVAERFGAQGSKQHKSGIARDGSYSAGIRDGKSVNVRVRGLGGSASPSSLRLAA